ncbi:23S rRNA (guanosine-2'-O-)-methyltransferase RlmB [Sporotomaculum syntrophicum]|uniref:23S rRNA (Guanosine-2'-O-)-methyltransferase RlmB n=1 Tax=Sporotomaculum syntrophicum TaxID=182264 RepID=A0A9D3AZB6_9FIRM|nr:RNA methyltransferase [Sporotomaculum syntrophicum]KAF1085663.1 23S rRNA (guanosine-2'-O-)-methyltransferase RlmB [Sporotomaculum syntrophicum]
MLQSKHNLHIKYVRRLAQRKFRERERKFIIEGVRFLEEALKVNWPLELVMHTPGIAVQYRAGQLLEILARRCVPLLTVDDSLFQKLADTESPQGMLAVARVPEELEADPRIWAAQGRDLMVLVDGIRDPGNLGTVIRCADAAGAGGVLLLKGSVDPYNPKTLRSTMGSIFHVPLISVGESDRLLLQIPEAGWRLVVGEPGAGKLIHQCDLTGRVVLAVGSEADGVSGAVRQAACEKVRIPMPGRAESLNAGVAAGIMLYEAVRQRTL